MYRYGYIGLELRAHVLHNQNKSYTGRGWGGPFPGNFDSLSILQGPRTYIVKRAPNIILISQYIWKVFDLELFSADELDQKHQKRIFFSLKHRCLHGYVRMRDRDRDRARERERDRERQRQRRENILIFLILKQVIPQALWPPFSLYTHLEPHKYHLIVHSLSDQPQLR